MSASRHNIAAAAAVAFIGSADADAVREFAFSDEDFKSLSKLAYEQAGIVLAESKRNLIYGRLSRRLRALGMTTFRDYRALLMGDGGVAELQNFINSISTNLTKFFRESHHFDHFRSAVAVPYAQARSRSNRRLRVWSAGCSTGEEPYTIAVILQKEMADVARHDVRVLATDIDTEVLSKAARGEYPENSVEDVPKAYRGYFELAKGERGPLVRLSQPIRSLIAFRQLNLLETWPFQGQFDAIFCRNVMIYFDGPTKNALVERFIKKLIPGGWLYIGHSESLLGSHPGLKLMGRTIYRREG
jgi:chemotaxis protein methyltransferase CheR